VLSGIDAGDESGHSVRAVGDESAAARTGTAHVISRIATSAGCPSACI
jgi:hypothetical protein